MVENLIYQAISEVAAVRDKLARYDGKPAVFFQLAPNDKSPLWDGDVMYPRVDYGVDWSSNPSRKAAGSLLVNIWGTNESETPAEEIAAAVQTELSELFLTDDSGTYCMVWDRSDYFESTGEKEPKTEGYTISFDVLAFPQQETITPDPVRAVNSLVKEIEPQVTAIGHDALAAMWKPTDATPAVYVRIISNVFSHGSYAVSWMNITLGVHVIAPNPTARQTMLQQITHSFNLRGEAILNDGSPLFVKKMQFNTSADPLRNGQMTITGEYGVLATEPESEKLWNVHNQVNFGDER